MEPSANYNITNQMTIRQMSLYNPEQDKLAQVLETGLKKHFLTAEVKWVECPDLTQKPFNLAAPGLCGEPAFIDLGDASYLTSPPKMNRVYDIPNILKLLEPPYCGSSNSFIFGNSVFRTTFPEDLFELVINQMMSVTDQEVRDICNRSHTIYTNARRCNVEKIVTLYNYKFNMQGTFFLCQGLTTKSVLQVYAKTHRPNSQYLDDPSGFINSMQDELQKTFDATGYYVEIERLSIYSLIKASQCSPKLFYISM
ncbi:ester hydrolase C11orf54 homolog isoform X2 [Anoplolepis gracilipes]|uniref:ester hydrolase C11orf54 homolog isoform X2 n=1 Tax=Anoplolepis gracilipes TaxID=354296 RepID=UPI003BA1BF7A